MAVPGTAAIDTTSPTWSFPTDSVLVKTLSLAMEQGNPDSLRRVETQILHHNGLEWRPYTYRWNEEQSDAVLVNAAGDEQTFNIADLAAPGGTRQQTWRYSGRGECQRCHNSWSGPPLAFNTPQLNRHHDYDGRPAPQLETLAHVGLLNPPVLAENRPRLADPRDTSAAVDDRARAYLQVNCAHCHRMHAGSAVLSYMHYDLSFKAMNMVGVRPTQGTFGIVAARVIAAGDPFRSVLLYRLSKLGGGHMPPIGNTEIDREGIDLIEQWIRQVPGEMSPDRAGGDVARTMRRDEATALERLVAAIDSTEQAECLDRLLTSASGALMLTRAIDERKLRSDTVARAIAAATAHDDLQIRDLFERFLPAERRTRRLGSIVDADSLLAMAGDASRGQQLYLHNDAVQCRKCHRVNDVGEHVGPDLSRIGGTRSRAQLLESILEPSKRIDPPYVTYLVETTDGLLLSGILIEQAATEIVLKEARNRLIRVPRRTIHRLEPTQNSLMPDLLFQDMTGQQVADLVAYLSSLK